MISRSLSCVKLPLFWAEASPTSQLRRENDVLRMQAGLAVASARPIPDPNAEL